MNTAEISEALQNITILVDTREHSTLSLEDRLSSFPCPTVRKKLNFGDYSIKCILRDGIEYSLEGLVSVERKMSLDELAGNLTRGRDRFERELERMKAVNGKMFLVCEKGSYDKILMHNYRSQYPPKAFLSSLCAYEARYGFVPHFVSSQNSALLIYNLLYYELRERLKDVESVE